ncbi:hypothetical protein FE633_04605 [Streptomyces montanus]|uniref:Uncharacterized protein n=1 Tax=Streptomyces montanus TaxID=2580423 RepID=A0A5R9FZ63_9ACTN|nr:hypothetical protein [Streptomyces montanus]TLS47316.1 hypothetical protein FE633_04605 [Streptomyces montanus]
MGRHAPCSEGPEADGFTALEGEAADRVRASALWLALCSAPDGPNASVLRDMIKQETRADDVLLDALLADQCSAGGGTRHGVRRGTPLGTGSA